MKEIEKTQKRKSPLDALKMLNKSLQENSKTNHIASDISPENPTPKRRKKSKRERQFEEEYVPPEPVKHEFFDESISKYFKTPRTTPKSLEGDDTVQEKTKNVLIENVYRMFGITAFPVKDPSCPDTQLGVRIEIFNELEFRFETPHYIILEQNPKTMKWCILNHTVPAFVQLRTLAASYDDLSSQKLFNFVCHVRHILQLTSLKHQIIDRLKFRYKKYVSSLQKDISMTTIKFQLSIKEAETGVTMRCGLDSVESVFIENGFTDFQKRRACNLLKGDIHTLMDRFGEAVEVLTE